MAFKLKAIAAAEAESKQAAARQFKVDARRVREWCSQKEKLTALKKRGRREASDIKTATARRSNKLLSSEANTSSSPT